MKKKSSKNYIAFTLTEMTMVLLIMSIIAAVSAPLVKHAVTDVVSSSVAESTGIWKKISNLSGIFYSSVGNGIVSIGTIPGGESINYGYPAMIIQSNGGDLNDNHYAQIGVYSDSTWKSAEYPNKIALDRYNNIAVGQNINYTNPNRPSYGKIEMGNIGPYTSDESRLYKNYTANRAVIMGIGILEVAYASANNSILIGRSLAETNYDANPLQTFNSFDDTIAIGTGSSISSVSDGIFYATGSVNIGSRVASSNIQNLYNVNIGTEVSAFVDKQIGNVNIGTFSNRSWSGGNNTGSINIGRYAGTFTQSSDDAGEYIVTSAGNYGNVFVGKFAGSYLSRSYLSSVKNGGNKYARRNNVAIGLNTLTTAWQYEQLQNINRQNTLSSTKSVTSQIAFMSPISTQVLASDIAIGAFAGNNFMAPFAINGYDNATPYANHNLIFIGAYAGADALPYYYLSEYYGPLGSPAEGKHSLYGTIAVGEFAGYKMGRYRGGDGNDTSGALQESDNAIMLGYYAGYSNRLPSIIAIGSYAGSTTNSDYISGLRQCNHEDTNIYIGEFAGYRSKGHAIGIGRYACANVNTYASMCFGNFPYASTGTPFTVGSAWGVQGNSYTAYFYAGAGVAQESDLILASSAIYSKDGTLTLVTSDARSKRKISLVRYGVKNFRKFNIYNFSLKADKTHKKHIGVIAQEYAKAFPRGLDKNGKYYSVKLDWLYYSMINAIKDLDRLVQEFQAKVDEYVNNFESVKYRIEILEQSINAEKEINANMRKELEQINAQINLK